MGLQWACRVFTSGGGVNRAPQNWGGGVGKRAQLTDTILTNEKVGIHVFQESLSRKFCPLCTHPCSRASLPMRWSVDGRYPPLLMCLSAHVLERGWEAPTLAHVPLCPCVALGVGDTDSHALVWPLELRIRTPTLQCGPSSWGYGLPRFGVAPGVRDMDSHTSVWPLELGIRTP